MHAACMHAYKLKTGKKGFFCGVQRTRIHMWKLHEHFSLLKVFCCTLFVQCQGCAVSTIFVCHTAAVTFINVDLHWINKLLWIEPHASSIMWIILLHCFPVVTPQVLPWCSIIVVCNFVDVIESQTWDHVHELRVLWPMQFTWSKFQIIGVQLHMYMSAAVIATF